MPKIDLNHLELLTGRLPPQLATYTKGLTDRIQTNRVGDAAGLTQFGVNRTILPPGTGTSLRHWHMNEDEFVIIMSGVANLMDNDGEHHHYAGDRAGFKAGVANGHSILNKSEHDVILFEIGTRADEENGYYSDVDLQVKTYRRGVDKNYEFTTRDAAPVHRAKRPSFFEKDVQG